MIKDYFSEVAETQYKEARACWNATTEQQRERYGCFDRYFSVNWPNGYRAMYNIEPSAEDEWEGAQTQRSRHIASGFDTPHFGSDYQSNAERNSAIRDYATGG